MLRGHYVLIIEDEPLIALDLDQAPSAAGAQAGICNTLHSALEAAEGSTVTAAIVDLRLHDQSVREVVERLATRNVPIILDRDTHRGLVAQRSLPGQTAARGSGCRYARAGNRRQGGRVASHDQEGRPV
jgi:hypothetical protein